MILATLTFWEFILNKTRKSKKKGLKRVSKTSWMVNFSVRYAYEFFFEICLCVFIQIAVAHQSH